MIRYLAWRYGIWDINEISIWASTWDMGYRYGIWYIDMVIHHIDMVILDIDMGYKTSIWEMTVSILFVMLDIDMGYLVLWLPLTEAMCRCRECVPVCWYDASSGTP